MGRFINDKRASILENTHSIFIKVWDPWTPYNTLVTVDRTLLSISSCLTLWERLPPALPPLLHPFLPSSPATFLTLYYFPFSTEILMHIRPRVLPLTLLIWAIVRLQPLIQCAFLVPLLMLFSCTIDCS